MTKSATDIRAINFTKHGIDIVDGVGKTLRPSHRGVESPATIPRNTFLACENGEELLELWRQVVTCLGLDVSELATIEENVVEWPEPKGLDRIKANSKHENPKQNIPPNQMDALWLLEQFLNERFPAGGVFRTASIEDMPDSTEDLTAFVSFLKRPEYTNHPYTAGWLADLDRAAPRVTTLDPNFWLLRSITKIAQKRWDQKRGKKGRPWSERADRTDDTEAVKKQQSRKRAHGGDDSPEAGPS
ncbi:hypothetical protein PG985_005002 [Apiospora marii]|uniref:uncharacterized protein n=1 Tax=Apiospora marii TaxID=335849 RepID=UPI00312DE913